MPVMVGWMDRDLGTLHNVSLHVAFVTMSSTTVHCWFVCCAWPWTGTCWFGPFHSYYGLFSSRVVHGVIWKSALLMQGAAGLHAFQPRESLQDQLFDWIKDQVQLKSIDFEVKDENSNATS